MKPTRQRTFTSNCIFMNLIISDQRGSKNSCSSVNYLIIKSNSIQTLRRDEEKWSSVHRQRSPAAELMMLLDILLGTPGRPNETSLTWLKSSEFMSGMSSWITSGCCTVFLSASRGRVPNCFCVHLYLLMDRNDSGEQTERRVHLWKWNHDSAQPVARYSMTVVHSE